MKTELSKRELEVHALVRRAMSNREIATELRLSEGTVKEYLNRIYRKLNLKNRTSFALWEPKCQAPKM